MAWNEQGTVNEIKDGFVHFYLGGLHDPDGEDEI